MKRWLLALVALPVSGLPLPAQKAAEAAYVQTGTSGGVDKVVTYMNDTYAKPYSIDRIAAGYGIYRRREIRFKVGADTVSVRPYQITVEVPF